MTWIVLEIHEDAAGQSSLFFGPFPDEAAATKFMNREPVDPSLVDSEIVYVNHAHNEDLDRPLIRIRPVPLPDPAISTINPNPLSVEARLAIVVLVCEYLASAWRKREHLSVDASDAEVEALVAECTNIAETLADFMRWVNPIGPE